MTYKQSLLLSLHIVLFVSGSISAADHPNILWLTSEDNSPYLGCYGDPLAKTPNLDRLAQQGIRYRHAFAPAPVCSAARSSLITGMYATSTGIDNHRSSVPIPSSFEMYPDLLRKAGYYCTNNTKRDYNFAVNGKRDSDDCWDDSSKRAHYRNRAPGQSFFAIFNTTTSHEGQTTDKTYLAREKQGLFPKTRIVAPEDVILPPYHPDTPTIRENWSRYYNNMWLMDQEIGAWLQELEDEGLADNTIIFYYGDHGGALPRGKRNIHDSGTRVPLILRFPEKWAHLAPAKPGEWVDDMVNFIDFPASLCSLLDIPIPKNYQGTPFLGPKAKRKNHVYLFRSRMDERYDSARAIRTPDYLYINNFTPHRPWGQPYDYPFQVMATMGSWYQAFQAGTCNAVQARYWQTKPGEEFYLVKKDPHQITNLIHAKKQAKTIAKLRQLMRQRLIETRDIGLIPEGMCSRLAQNQTIYAYAQSPAYPIEQVADLAIKATSRNATDLPALQQALADPHPVLRYWAATGCAILQAEAKPARKQLMPLLKDPLADVRVTAAEALAYLQASEEAQAVLVEVVKNGNEYEALAALTTLEHLVRAQQLPLSSVQADVKPIPLETLCLQVKNSIGRLQ